jgi:hypothetical protein
MKFSIGDAILLKRTGEEGHIVAFLSDAMVEVEVKGTHFPVYVDEVDHPYLKWFTEKKEAKQKKYAAPEIPPEKIKERPARLAQGIYLSFMPVFVPDSFEDIVAHFRIFFINETAAPVYFTYEVRSASGALLFRHQASLHAFANVYLHPLSLGEMNEQPRFHWSVAEATSGAKAIAKKGLLRIKPARLFGQINHLLHTNEPAFNYLLADDAQPIPGNGQSILPVSVPNRPASMAAIPKWKPVDVLDLHIEALVSDAALLSVAEILRIQLEVLEYHLDMAIAYNQRQMIIIHGIGNGKLKEEVHRMLATQRSIDSFINRWLGRYGFGATEVIFKS